jgi:hypothetical protein
VSRSNAKRRRKEERHIQGKFVALPNWMADTPAWRSLSVNGRALWFELMRRWKGPRVSNNGDLYLSTREGSDLMGLSRPTVSRAFRELEHKGFVRMMKETGFGYRDGGKRLRTAPRYAVTHEPVGNAKATKDFLNWKPPGTPQCAVKRRPNGAVADENTTIHAVGADAGLRRTQADKRYAVETLLKDPEWSRLSDRKIAKAARVSHPTVSKIRAELTGKITNSPVSPIDQ